MTFLQINLALMAFTVVLASLMGACLFYSMKTMKSRITKLNETNDVDR